MKLALPLRIATLATLALTSIIPFSSSKAATFSEQDVAQEQVIAIARPYGDNKYDLLVIEQIPGKQQCWSEGGTNPVVVNPLLLNFDFTGICRRATDSNGYSIRMNGQDYGLDLLLRLVQRNGELVLVGTSRTNPGQEIVVGRTKGMSQGFLKVQLEPGWWIKKRAFQGKTLGHFYFSNQPPVPVSATAPPAATATPTKPKPTPTTAARSNTTNASSAKKPSSVNRTAAKKPAAKKPAAKKTSTQKH
jgi:hypothetical protein